MSTKIGGLSQQRLRIVIGGYLGLLPGGGITWDYLQYPLGFAELGHDVYYIEDTGHWPVFQKNGDGSDCTANVRHLASVMGAFGFQGRWAYRDAPTDQWFGLSAARVEELCRSADVFLNISCSTVLRDEYREIPVRILLDSDPMFTQIQNPERFAKAAEWHSDFVTFGEHIGQPDCRIPTRGLPWRASRQPICLQYWPISGYRGGGYTTVMNWTASAPILHAGESWGQKDVEFERFMTIPTRLPGVPFAVAVNQTVGASFPRARLEASGWTVLDPHRCVGDWRSYRAFIAGSRGEFSVAKETYVKGRTGWFSCRSACYLAAGRPVVTQDTRWSCHLPTGEGLFAFTDEDSAIAALESIESRPEFHGEAARALAEQYFASARVLTDLLSPTMVI